MSRNNLRRFAFLKHRINKQRLRALKLRKRRLTRIFLGASFVFSIALPPTVALFQDAVKPIFSAFFQAVNLAKSGDFISPMFFLLLFWVLGISIVITAYLGVASAGIGFFKRIFDEMLFPPKK